MATNKKNTSPRRRKSDATIADWGSVDPRLLGELIAAIGRFGGAVRFGYSRDGGAYAVGIYGDGEPFTEYLSGTQDATDWISGFIQDYE